MLIFIQILNGKIQLSKNIVYIYCCISFTHNLKHKNHSTIPLIKGSEGNCVKMEKAYREVWPSSTPPQDPDQS